MSPSSPGKPFARCVVVFALLAITSTVSAADQPRNMPSAEELGRPSRNHYGSLEQTIQSMRAHQPLDLNAARWRRAHPRGSYEEWKRQAQSVLANGLHYDAGKVELNAVTTDRWETDSFIRETIEFNTAPWFRVPGYFYVPKNVPLPAGRSNLFRNYAPKKPHCYDAEIQAEALAWFDLHLKKRPAPEAAKPQ